MNFIPKAIAILLIAVSSFSSNADIIPADFLHTNDQLITVDTETGLGWLDWSYTTVNTYDQIFARINDVNDVLYGFEYASVNDFARLVDSLGLETGIGAKDANANATLLRSMLGTITSSTYNQTYGITDTLISRRYEIVSVATKVFNEDYEVQLSRSVGIEGSHLKDFYGHALIIDMANAPFVTNDVPEPAPWLLLMSGMIVIAARKAYKR